MMDAMHHSSLLESPLTDAHAREVALARSRIKLVHKAAKVASFNGWATGVAAVLSAPFALFSIAGAVMTLALSVVAYTEFRARRRLLNFDPTGANLLGWNQLGFLAMIAGYCACMLWAALTGPSPLAAELQAQPELGEALGSLDGFDEMYKNVAVAFYGTVLAIGVAVQGWTAMYYFASRKHVVACLRDTPEWVMRLERATGV